MLITLAGFNIFIFCVESMILPKFFTPNIFYNIVRNTDQQFPERVASLKTQDVISLVSL